MRRALAKRRCLLKATEALRAQGVSVGGMISREAREGNVRVGFEIIDLTSGKHGWLAHVDQKVGPRVGKYHVNIGDLENIGAKAIVEAAEKCAVVAIDEIGPMELYSQKFKQAVEQALLSEKMVIAVVHAKARDELVSRVKQRKDAAVFTVGLSNRDSLPRELNERVLGT